MAAKNKFMNAMKMPAIADMFSSEADRQRESGDLVTEVPLSELHPFVNHPFEVRDDEDMQKLVDSIHAADYSSVYIANLPADYDLDRCFQEFNAPNRPLRYHMCSLSTSDIVVTTKNGKETAYYVDSIGFKDVSYLLPELHEVEAQRQKEQVQDEPER